MTWGNSDEAKVGDWVVAVGNPFGLGGTVTTGIVSALGVTLMKARMTISTDRCADYTDRCADQSREFRRPTFDLHDRVIGINTAIYSPSGGPVGIGFAAPSSTAKDVVDQLEQHGRVTWGKEEAIEATIGEMPKKMVAAERDEPIRRPADRE